MTQASVESIDTSDMVSVHRVFREALAAAPRLVRAARPDAEQVRTVRSYLHGVLRLLHAHHDGEDELLTPKLIERSPDAADAVTRIARQHEPVAEALAAADAALGSWRADDDTSTDQLVEALDVLRVELTAHLDEEERVVLPIAAAHLTQQEWGELPGHAMRRFGPDELWLALGLVAEQMTPAQRADMDAHLPPPVAQQWASSGQAQFTAFTSRLRGNVA